MIQTANPTSPTSAALKPPLWLVAAVLTAAFFVSQHEFTFSRSIAAVDVDDDAVDQLATGAAEGSAGRQVAFLAIGLLGVWLLLRRGGRSWQPNHPLVVLGLLLFAWCLLSLLWATDPAISGRRLAILVLLCLGALGMARQLELDDLPVVAIFISGGFLAIGIGAELALGTFRPFSGEYRFAGTLHPNSQAANCAILCLAAASLWDRIPGRNRYLAILLVVSGVFFALTRSRNSGAALIVALAVPWFVRASWQARAMIGIGGLCLASAWLLTLEVLGIDSKIASDILLMGRSGDAASLSGRVPLWGELCHYVGQRPLIGYGAGSFWSQDSIHELSEALSWGITSAHSSYLEATLSIGLIGVSLLVLFTLVGLRHASFACRASNSAGAGLLVTLLVFDLVYAVGESGCVAPIPLTFLTLWGLVHLALRTRDTESAYADKLVDAVATRDGSRSASPLRRRSAGLGPPSPERRLP